MGRDVAAEDTADVESDEHRDVYAHFGLAYFLSDCVHRGLVSVFAYLPYDRTTASRPWVEEREARAAAMTLGELATAAKPLLPFESHAELDWAVERRNHLAHGFWWERTHELSTAEGRARLVKWLTDTADRFHALDQVVDHLVRAHMTKLGVTDEDFERLMDHVRRHPPDPPVPRRSPRVEERIHVVQAWLAATEGPLTALILIDGDGRAWQLAETGLGWSHETAPAEGWTVFASLQRWLPAEIVARPKGARPWDYKLHLSNGRLLTVSRGSDGIMRFGVRAARPGTSQRRG